jgi:hypothetical protein
MVCSIIASRRVGRDYSICYANMLCLWRYDWSSVYV